MSTEVGAVQSTVAGAVHIQGILLQLESEIWRYRKLISKTMRDIKDENRCLLT